MGNPTDPPAWIAETVSRVTRQYQTANPTNPFASPNALFDGYIPSSRAGNRPYRVVVTDRNSSCECLAFTKYNRGADCSHIRMVKETLST